MLICSLVKRKLSLVIQSFLEFNKNLLRCSSSFFALVFIMKTYLLIWEIICALGIALSIIKSITSCFPFTIIYILLGIGFLINFIALAIKYEDKNYIPKNEQLKINFKLKIDPE